MSINRDLIISELQRRMGAETLTLLRQACEKTGLRARVVGGYPRDLILGRPTSDIDIVVEGSGIEFAQEVARLLGRGAKLSVFRNFGTAQVSSRKGLELEFVGARRESYRADSRKPIVEDGTFQDDERRRDFTINAMSIALFPEEFGAFIDPFNGLKDLDAKVVRTPLDPDTTFSDDPLRMMRAVRFASQLEFTIPLDTMASIRRNAERLRIVSKERITEEFLKIMGSPRPSVGLSLMEQGGLMDVVFPEVVALKGAETKEGIGHKDNFSHTLIVVDQLAAKTPKIFLRLAALFHDIAKPVTKKYEKGVGWTFYNHNFIGAKMIPRIFSRVKLPMDERMRYVQKLVNLHMRPAQLADDGVTDSAVRRLLFEAGEDVEDLMLLCEADMTSKNPVKIARYLKNFAIVRQKLIEIEEKDRIRNFQPPISGDEIMSRFGLAPCASVGEIKEQIKEAILDGKIPNEYDAALEYMNQLVEAHPEILEKGRKALPREEA